MIYEIINPSDPYTLEAKSLKIASVANLLLGEGSYGLESEDVEKCKGSPIFLFGGAEEWFQKEFDQTIKEIIDNNLLEIAKCLDSVLPMNISERKELQEENNHQKIDVHLKREEILDKRRTSLNNIGQRAWNLAEKIRKIHEESQNDEKNS